MNNPAIQFAVFVLFAAAFVFMLWKVKAFMINRGHADKIEKLNKLMEPRSHREARRMAESIRMDSGKVERIPGTRRTHVHVIIED